jgi:hypothetical protein
MLVSQTVHLLYLDDSGSVKNADDHHLILAGGAVFERRPFWFSRQLDELAGEIAPQAPQALEFRGSDILPVVNSGGQSRKAGELISISALLVSCQCPMRYDFLEQRFIKPRYHQMIRWNTPLSKYATALTAS